MTTRKYQLNKRKGSKPVLTKRTARNAKKWKSRVEYAVRMLNRSKYFKYR